MSGGADRAAIAREVLSSADYQAHIGKALKSLGKAWPVLSDHASHIDGEFSNALDDVKRLAELVADAHPAAPPAPVTVTVENVEWTLHPDLGWVVTDDDSPPNKADAIEFLNRIAADAARIAELEDSCEEWEWTCRAVEDERDAARRALEEAKSRPTPNSSQISSSPAPIPLGAVVEVENDSFGPYRHNTSGWRSLAFGYGVQDNGWGHIITALYHARHPVATRETVDAVRKLLRLSSQHGDTFAETADAVLVALGYTLQEGV